MLLVFSNRSHIHSYITLTLEAKDHFVITRVTMTIFVCDVT